MFAMYDQRFSDILLLILGFLGVSWFFFDLGNHSPMSTIEIPLSNEQAIANADSIFSSWQYQSINLSKKAEVSSYYELVDQLQEKYGRSNYIQRAKNKLEPSLPIYNWFVNEFSVVDGKTQNAFKMVLSKEGEMVSFEASNDIISEQTPFNRQLLSQAFKEQELTEAEQDSAITSLVNFQHLRGDPNGFFRLGLGSRRGNQDGFVWLGVDQYIKNSYWKRFSFTRDSLQFDEDGVVRYAKVFLTSKDTVMGVVPKLEMEIMPAGVIRKLSVDLGDYKVIDNGVSRLKVNVTMSIVLLLIVWILVSFYLRIKARSIDTQPALIIAVVSGFMVSLLLVLFYAKNLGVGFNSGDIASLFNEILTFGLAGAVSATAFFVVTAVSDSVTRQYWPDKLKTWDLVRRGMFKNKPIGWAIIRAVSIGSILIGVYTIILRAFPEIPISGKVDFISGVFVFAPFANILLALLTVIAFVVLIFMVVGNQVYAITSKKWLVPILIGVIFMVQELPFDGASVLVTQLLINFCFGFLIGYFYIIFDFVTIALSLFIFLNYISTSNGWLVVNSPDGTVFIGFISVLIFFVFAALYFLLMGDDKDTLPEYIPEYIEDLAKSERFKQELDIARSVQKAFLPSITPHIKNFDSAAVCFPAQESGGDYYDIISLEDTRTAIAIGDVSGKGIQAAFYMTFAKGVIHSLCTIFPSPKMMLFRVNKLFNQHATRGTFISMIYGVLNSDDRTFTYIRAGHNPMLFKKANGEISWLQPKGVAIGMSKGEVFNKVMEEATIKIDEGDVLVLYTDGITEAQNEEESFYDETRLLKLIKREKTNSAQELRDLIIEDVRTFIGDAVQYDDMTLVIIKG